MTKSCALQGFWEDRKVHPFVWIKFMGFFNTFFYKLSSSSTEIL